MPPIIIISGPAKTGTTWFYNQLMFSDELYIFGGKESAQYSKIFNTQKKFSKKIKYLIIFDHNVTKKDHLLNQLKNHDLIFITIVRDSVARISSLLNNLIKTGEIKKEKLSNEKFIDDFVKKNLYAGHMSYINKLNKKHIVVDFDDIDKRPLVLMKKLSKYLGINPKFYKKNVFQNPSQESKFIPLTRFFKVFIKPIFFKIGLSKVWSYLHYNSFINSIFFKNKSLYTNFVCSKKLMQIIKKDHMQAAKKINL